MKLRVRKKTLVPDATYVRTLWSARVHHEDQGRTDTFMMSLSIRGYLAVRPMAKQSRLIECCTLDLVKTPGWWWWSIDNPDFVPTTGSFDASGEHMRRVQTELNSWFWCPVGSVQHVSCLRDRDGDKTTTVPGVNSYPGKCSTALHFEKPTLAVTCGDLNMTMREGG